MPEQGSRSVIEVSLEEGGQKLLQFLLRRLNLPQPMLHRWIRTGQIRCNGGRCKPFDHVQTGDAVRLPPFALGMHAATVEHSPTVPSPALPSAQGVSAQPDAPSSAAHTVPLSAPLPLPPVVHSDTHLLVFNKPGGLPVHTGTGHSDSLATRLAVHHSDAPFRPTPAHRLDKDTSGLLLVARSYTMLRALQEAFKDRRMHKEYLAWVQGIWPHEQPLRLCHQLAKRYTGPEERVHALPSVQSTEQLAASARLDGKEAACVVACLHHRADAHGGCSLMHIRLITGRTHQIRAQLSAAGHPVCGDGKYGAAPLPAGLRLHALRIILPPDPQLAPLPPMFTVLPPWEGPFAVEAAPAPLTVPAP